MTPGGWLASRADRVLTLLVVFEKSGAARPKPRMARKNRMKLNILPECQNRCTEPPSRSDSVVLFAQELLSGSIALVVRKVQSIVASKFIDLARGYICRSP